MASGSFEEELIGGEFEWRRAAKQRYSFPAGTRDGYPPRFTGRAMWGRIREYDRKRLFSGMIRIDF